MLELKLPVQFQIGLLMVIKLKAYFFFFFSPADHCFT